MNHRDDATETARFRFRPMKQLLLIRHAKSDWDHPGLSDHDRPLNDRGRRDCPRMAEALRSRGITPDLIVTSTAVRAATTAEAIAGGLGLDTAAIARRSELYLAPPQLILRVIQGLDESAETVLIFGHNPGMHEAVGRLCGDEAVGDFPTLAVARIELDVDHWGAVEWGDGVLLECIVPRGLEAE
jgi:phosphohistidine phosphatase